MTLDRVSRRIEAARRHAAGLQRRAGQLEPAATAALDQAVEELKTALDELQAADEQVREQEAVLLTALASVERERDRYRDLFESAPTAYVITSTTGVIRDVNQAAAALLEQSAQLLVGKPLVTFVERQDLRHFFAELQALRQNGQTTRELRVRLGSWRGASHPVSLTVTPVRRRSGELVMLRWAIKETDEQGASPPPARADALARLATIVETTTDAIISKTVEGIITSWNPGAERLFGYTSAEMTGRPLAHLAPPEVREEYQNALIRVRQGERVPPFDTVRLHKSGRRVEVNVSLSPIVDDLGNVVGVSAVARDISERRALEHLREELLALTSRELRSPLGALRSYAEQLGRHQRTEPAVRGIVELAEHLDRLVGDLADDSLVETGHVDLRLRSVDLVALTQVSADHVSARSSGHAVKIQAPPQRVVGRWDRQRIAQVLDDILDIAMQHLPGGGLIVVEIEALGNEARMTVTTEGTAGIHPDQLPRLFERLRRPPSTGRARRATVSLWIARTLVEAHGGRLWAEPRHGVGAVLLLLPYNPPVDSRRSRSVLTPRQVEIAGLIAQGRSNREIAEALVLSQTAVENHVARILRRLGVKNRTAVASWAVEVGLALAPRH